MTLERDIVVGDLGGLGMRFFGRALIHAAVGCRSAGAAASSAGTFSATEHDQIVHDDFSLIFFLAGFLVVPRAGAQRAFDVNRASLFQVFASDLGGASEGGEVVPLG